MLAMNLFFLRAGAGVGSPSGWSSVNPVTIVKRKYAAVRDRWHIHYKITGDSGYTLQTRLKKIDAVICNDVTITKTSWDRGTITFVASGPFTNTELTVIGTTQ